MLRLEYVEKRRGVPTFGLCSCNGGEHVVRTRLTRVSRRGDLDVVHFLIDHMLLHRDQETASGTDPRTRCTPPADLPNRAAANHRGCCGCFCVLIAHMRMSTPAESLNGITLKAVAQHLG